MKRALIALGVFFLSIIFFNSRLGEFLSLLVGSVGAYCVFRFYKIEDEPAPTPPPTPVSKSPSQTSVPNSTTSNSLMKKTENAYDYQLIRLPNGRDLRIHKHIFEFKFEKVSADFNRRIYFERSQKDGKNGYHIFINADDVTHDEWLYTSMGLFRQLHLEGHTSANFEGKATKKFVEYSMYAYRYTEGIDINMKTLGICQLAPDDEYDMVMLYKLAKYLKENNGVLPTGHRVELPVGVINL